MTLSPSQSQTTPRYSWSEIWTAVLTRPSVDTFQEILRDPAVSRRRAYTWVIVALVINVIFVGILRAGSANEMMAAMPRGSRLSPADIQSFMLTSTLCAIPFALVIGFISFRMIVGLTQFVARQLGGDVHYASDLSGEKAKNSDPKGNAGTLVTYSFAAVQAPLNIVSLLFAALPANPITAIISLVATGYQVYLMSLGLRAVYGFSTGRAVASVILGFVLFLFLIFATIFAVFFVLARL